MWKNNLRLAEQIARAAAQSLTPADRQAKSSSGKDIKIKADQNLHFLIKKQLQRKSSYAIISEEDSFPNFDQSEKSMRWIIDPLDGSLNFHRQIPLCCVSIGLWEGMNPILGVIYDFMRKEMFIGAVGHGAWLNGKPLRVSPTSRKSDAILCTGFSVYGDFSKDSLVHLASKIRAYKRVRLLGSAALSLAYVACGRADVYEEKSIALWDVAAGAALVRSAGGKVLLQVATNKPFCSITAGNPRLVFAKGSN